MTQDIQNLSPDTAHETSPVLVVDDSKAQRVLISRTLRKWGYETIEAASGREALQICQGSNVEYVISDWMMPEMSGVEFCRAYRSHMAERSGYFILLTAQNDREFLAEGLESGADDFLTKPFDPTELRARLRSGRRVVNAQKALSSKNAELTDALDELSTTYKAIEKDLKGARRFQEALVPDRHLRVGDIDLSILFQPSGHVGGDLVGYFKVNENEIGVYSVDVSGHGVASALMTARIASYFSSTAPDRNIALIPRGLGYRMRPLQDVCQQLNDILQADRDSDQYLTVSVAKVELGSGRVELCHAGHPSPAVQRANGEIVFHDLFSTPIGLVDGPEFARTRIDLDIGDRLILYSDGLTECENPYGGFLDETGLATLLAEHSAITGPDLVEAIQAGLITFRGSLDFDDDLSAVVIQRL